MRRIFLLISFILILALCPLLSHSQEAGGDTQLLQHNVNFSGKWDPTHDPLIVKPGDFSDIQNLRYRDQGLKGVSGFSKINSTALTTYLKIHNGFHFTKDQPSESHVLVQAYNSGLTASQVLQNETAIPSAGDFAATALHTDATGAGIGLFSIAPEANVTYCNGAESMIWGGDELKVSSFINYAPDDSFSYDYSEQLSNSLSDSENEATIHTVSGAGIDANVMLLLHLENNVTDATSSHTVTNVASKVTFSTTYKAMGSYGAVFNDTDAYLTIPDHADFDFSAGAFTIDAQIYCDALDSVEPIYYQETAGTGNDWAKLWVTSSGSVRFDVTVDNVGSPFTEVSISTDTGVITTGSWFHIELVENSNNWYIFVNGIQRAYLSDSDRCADYTGVVEIGHEGTDFFDGAMDEFRVSSSARHTEGFDPPALPYSTSTTEAYFYIGSPRPLEGFKIYVDTANTSTSTMSVHYWSGSTWVEVSSLSDGTSSGGKSLAQDGSVTFTSTDGSAKVKYIEGQSLYFYRVAVSAVAASKKLDYVTLDAPWQSIKNVWSGRESVVAAFKKYDNSTYSDYTLEVNDDSVSTFAVLDSLGTADHLLLGFVNPQQGFDLNFIGEHENNNNCILSAYYYDGDDWVLMPVFKDDTVEGSKSFAKSGTITFPPIGFNVEFPQTIDGDGPFYYYKFDWTNSLSGEVEIYLVSGIEYPDTIQPYNVSLAFQNRTLLCGREGGPSEVRISASGKADVFNGPDSTILNVSSGEIIAGKSLYNRLGSSIYNVAVLCTQDETHVLDGYAVTGTGQFTQKQVSSTIGCIAPKTMASGEVGYIGSVSKNVLFWLSYGGPVMFDLTALVPVKGVEPYFDTNDSLCIDYTYADRAIGFFDEQNKEYNLLIPSGSGQTANNVWLIYDIMRNRWTKKVPGAYPQSGFPVKDTYGQQHTYLGLDTGYLERNENGNDFDGTTIAQSVTFSEILPSGSLWEEARLDYMKFICESKGDSDDDISAYHRTDGDTSWTSLTDIPMYASGKRISHHTQRLNKIGIGHQFKFEISTDDVTDGFEPLSASFLYHVERLDVVQGARK